MSNDIVPNIIDGIAAVAAWAGAAASFFFAKRNDRIQKEQYQRIQPSLSLTIHNSRQKLIDDKLVLFTFNISIINQSDCDNVIKEVWLHINNSGDINEELKYGLRHDPSLTGIVNCTNVLEFPIKIMAHDISSGWLMYKISNEKLAKLRVDSYTLHLLDERNNVVEESEVTIKVDE